MGVDGLTMVTAKLDALAHELKKMNVNAVSTTSNCELCRRIIGQMSVYSYRMWRVQTMCKIEVTPIEIFTTHLRGIILTFYG